MNKSNRIWWVKKSITLIIEGQHVYPPAALASIHLLATVINFVFGSENPEGQKPELSYELA